MEVSYVSGLRRVDCYRIVFFGEFEGEGGIFRKGAVRLELNQYDYEPPIDDPRPLGSKCSCNLRPWLGG